MAYAKPTELLERYDARDIGDLVSDTGVAVGVAALPTNPKVLAALNDGAGEIDAALLMGNRYSPTQLANLTGNSSFHLIRINCDIAMAQILSRRPGLFSEKYASVMKMADDNLERLRNGENVFNLVENKDAGNISATGLSTVEYSQSGLIRDRTRHYYPRRNPGTNNFG